MSIFRHTASKETSCAYDFLARTPSPLRETRLRCTPPTGPTARPTSLGAGVVTDPEALAELGENPPGEALIEIPADVLRFFVQDEQGEER